MPRVYKDIDTKKYIAEELGEILYDVLKFKFGTEYVTKELNRYIPETRSDKTSSRMIFEKYFYDVVLYKEHSC